MTRKLLRAIVGAALIGFPEAELVLLRNQGDPLQAKSRVYYSGPALPLACWVTLSGFL